jgi:hypothetical protein
MRLGAQGYERRMVEPGENSVRAAARDADGNGTVRRELGIEAISGNPRFGAPPRGILPSPLCSLTQRNVIQLV